MSDKAQAMIDELVAASIAFGRGELPDWQTRIEKAQRELREYIAELEAERDQAKAAITRLRDYLYDYTNLRISVRQEDRWWALVDKFDELTKEVQP
jgi:hypothetical protein